MRIDVIKCEWDVIYNVYNVIKVVVIKGGYDVIYNAHDGIHMPSVMTSILVVMSSIQRVWGHWYSCCDAKYSGWNVRYSLCVVMKAVLWYHIYWIWCHKHKGCYIIYIYRGVMLYRVYVRPCILHMMHPYSVCDVIQRLGVL